MDRETAIQWATDAGFGRIKGPPLFHLVTPEQIQALITRAQNEAYEAAAERSDAFVYMSLNFETLSQDIRALKQDP